MQFQFCSAVHPEDRLIMYQSQDCTGETILESLCLTERQAEHIYKSVEKGNMINTKTMTNEMVQDLGMTIYIRG